MKGAMIEQLALALGNAIMHSLWQCALVGALASALRMGVRRAWARYGIWCAGLLACGAWFISTAVSGMRVGSAAPGGLASGAGAWPGQWVERTTGEAGAPGIRLLELVALLWALGFAFFAARFVLQWRAARGLRVRGVQEAKGEWAALFAALRGDLGVSRRVRLLVSGLAPCPMVVGWPAPVVIVPASVLTMLSPEQVRLVLAHELAHIRRCDHLVNMLQVIIETVLFYHPAVWWMSRQARIEREHCCDDAAVRLARDPAAFARALAELETVRSQSRALLALNQGGSLMNRINRILGGPDQQRGAGSLRALAVLATAGLIAGAGYAQALRTHEPRAETIEAVRAGVASGVMTEAQARRVYQEVLLPGSWLQDRCDLERAYWDEELGTYGLSEERLERTLEALERDFDQRIEQDFRTRVLGQDSRAVALSLYSEELERRKQEEGLAAGEAERLYAKRVEGMSKPALVINTPEPDGAQKIQHIIATVISSGSGTVDGAPVRLVAGNTVAGEYEVTEQAGADGAYKPGQRIRFAPGLPTSVYRVMVGKTEEELFSEQAPPESADPMGFDVRRDGPDRFELTRVAPDRTEAEMHEQEADQPLSPQVGGLLTIVPTIKPSEKGKTIELEIQIQDDATKLTPMDEEYWIHQGVRPVSEYDEGC